MGRKRSMRLGAIILPKFLATLRGQREGRGGWAGQLMGSGSEMRTDGGPASLLIFLRV